MTSAICGIPLETQSVERLPKRWCFGCRKRHPGTLTIEAPSLETLMATEAWGWAEPIAVYECDGCGDDRRLFPGWEWEWKG